jgi:hypothetical protein
VSKAFDENKFYERLKRYLDFNKTLYPITVTHDPDLYGLLIQLHQANTQTMLSINNIFKMDHTLDIFALARTMYESVINMGLLSSNLIPDGVERFKNYQDCETHRLISHLRDISYADITFTPDFQKEIKINRDKFIERYGSSDNWCGMNLLKRVQLLDKYYASSGATEHFLEFYYCWVYRVGSSGAHKSARSFSLTTKLIRQPSEKGSDVTIQQQNLLLLFFGLNSLSVYLLSIRFLGNMMENKKKEIEEFYQNENI